MLSIDETLLRVVVEATLGGLTLAEEKATPIGASRMGQGGHPVSVVVGLVGGHVGQLTMNLSEDALLHLASRVLGEPCETIDEDAIDAIMEVGNVVAGGIKEGLVNSNYEIREISLPSVAFGPALELFFSRGVTTCAVQFELEGLPFGHMRGRYFTTGVSLLRGSGARS